MSSASERAFIRWKYAPGELLTDEEVRAVEKAWGDCWQSAMEYAAGVAEDEAIKVVPLVENGELHGGRIDALRDLAAKLRTGDE